jgi:HSP20 family protein
MQSIIECIYVNIAAPGRISTRRLPRDERRKKMLMRLDPFREIDRLSQQIWGHSGATTRPTAMPMDAYGRDGKFVVHFDLPGVDPDSIDLTVEKNVLTVSAQRSWQPAEGDEVVANERPQGSFSRQLFLGESLNTEEISASYENGVLTITIPVAEQAKPRRVRIQNGGNGTAITASASA